MTQGVRLAVYFGLSPCVFLYAIQCKITKDEIIFHLMTEAL